MLNRYLAQKWRIILHVVMKVGIELLVSQAVSLELFLRKVHKSLLHFLHRPFTKCYGNARTVHFWTAVFCFNKSRPITPCIWFCGWTNFFKVADSLEVTSQLRHLIGSYEQRGRNKQQILVGENESLKHQVTNLRYCDRSVSTAQVPIPTETQDYAVVSTGLYAILLIPSL